jgi:polar amino acid transport system substrate-binding protein/arginine/ornithine transport system substrate-binding protein
MHRAWICRIAAIGAALFIAWGPAAAYAQDKLKLATEGTYPPWNYKDPSGQLVGWDIEIGNALCERMKAQCEFVAQEWDGIIPGLNAKKFDLIVASMGITAKRKEQVAFSNRYKDTISTFVAKKGTIKDTTVDSLAGKRIGVQRGSIQHDYLTKTYTKSDIVVYDKTTDVEFDLVSGRVDLMLQNKLTTWSGFFKKPDGAGFEFVGADLKGGLLGEGSGIAARKEDTALLERVNKALAEIIADGTYQKISDKYFPFKLLAQ